MIRVDVKQGTREWLRARMGVVTASAFDRIMTPKEWKAAKGAETYMNELLAESILGTPLDDEDMHGWIMRGAVMEREALPWYSFERNADVDRVGFLLREDGMVGCSPDGLVGEDGGLEIKTPSAANHVGYLRNPASLVSEYRGQVQGSLFLTGRAWWDLCAFNPRIRPVMVRCEPDAAWQAAFGPILESFVARYVAERERLAAEADALAADNPLA